MTLGRTASGAIKIKTDGGLRAVGCACCGGCGCLTSPISELLDPPDQLIEILDTAVFATCNGLSPQFWDFYPQGGTTFPGWYAMWFFKEIYTLRWFADTKCLSLGGDNGMNVIYSGHCEKCADPSGMSCIDQIYTINGTEFPCHSDIYDDFFPPVPSPVFVF